MNELTFVAIALLCWNKNPVSRVIFVYYSIYFLIAITETTEYEWLILCIFTDLIAISLCYTMLIVKRCYICLVYIIWICAAALMPELITLTGFDVRFHESNFQCVIDLIFALAGFMNENNRNTYHNGSAGSIGAGHKGCDRDT